MTIKLKRQPENSDLCGQTVIAMLANISIKKSIQLFKTENATDWKDIKNVLKLLKIRFNPKVKIIYKDTKKPNLCIVVVKFTNKYLTHNLINYEDVYEHFTLWYNGIFYDPSEGKIKDYKDDEYFSVKEISYLQIYKKL